MRILTLLLCWWMLFLIGSETMEMCNAIFTNMLFTQDLIYIRQWTTRASKTMTHVIKVIHNLFNLTEILIIKKTANITQFWQQQQIYIYFFISFHLSPETTTSKSQEISHLYFLYYIFYHFCIFFFSYTYLGNVRKIDCCFPSSVRCVWLRIRI